MPSLSWNTYPTILLFGGTGSGKTTLIGELAEHVYKTKQQKTRLATADRGGLISIMPYIELGIIELEMLHGDPWVWLNEVVKGNQWDDVKKVWNPGKNDNIGFYAFESMTSVSDAYMDWMAEASSRGVNIGGGGAFNFSVGEGTQKVKIGSNNMAHYGVTQQRVYNKATQSQMLPGIVLWTAGDSRGDDGAVGAVVGPQTAGKAQTGEVPRWFQYTFRAVVEVMAGQPTKHVLHLDHHMDMAAKGAKGIANARVPLAGADDVPIPPTLEPASLVRALELLGARSVAAKDTIKKRLGL